MLHERSVNLSNNAPLKPSRPDVLPGILGHGVALAGLLRQAHSQDMRGLQGDGNLAGAKEGQGGHRHVGQVGGRHLQAREVLIPAWMPLFMIKIFQTAF